MIPSLLSADHRKKPQCPDAAGHRPSFKPQSKGASRAASSSSSSSAFESRAARELRLALKRMCVDDEARREHAANLEDDIVDRFDASASASASASGHYSARHDIFNDGDDERGAAFAETEFDFENEL